MLLKCILAESCGACPAVNSSLFSCRTPLSGVSADCSCRWMLYNGVGWHTWAREGGEWEWVGLKAPLVGCAVLPPGVEASSSQMHWWSSTSLMQVVRCWEYIAVNDLSGFVGQPCVCDLILWLVKAVRAIDSFSSVFSQHCTSSPTVWGNAVLSFSECYRSFDQYVFLCGSHICTDTLTKWTKVSLWPQKSILLVANSTKT